MKSRWLIALAWGVLIWAAGCGGPLRVEAEPQRPAPISPRRLVPRAFGEILAESARLDAEGGWTPESCGRIGRELLALDEQYEGKFERPIAEVRFNAGVAFERCNMRDEAVAAFGAALSANGKLHQARVHLAMASYEVRGAAALDETIDLLRRVVKDAEYRSPEALLNLARLQMKRASDKDGTLCSNDVQCARLNILRALAVRPDNLPALNVLALYYLALSQGPTSGGGAKDECAGWGSGTAPCDSVREPALMLAERICLDALRRNPRYAPLHDTLGLIAFERGKVGEANASFAVARTVDPRLFAAHMNFAMTSALLGDRDGAVRAYEAARRLRPRSYEACLGLTASEEAALRCADLAPERPEAFLHAASLARAAKADTAHVRGLMRSFLDKAGGDPTFEQAVRDVRAMLQEGEGGQEVTR